MALLESNTSNLGMDAPDFDLLGTDGDRYSLSSFDEGRPLVVMFICNHCPYVKAVRERLVDLAHSYDGEVEFVAICSNDAERYPEDGYDRMQQIAEEWELPFPYLWDETQRVASEYGAVCTPDLYLFDEDRALAYRGRLDDNWKQPEQVTSHDLRDAIDAVLDGNAPAADQKPAMGCSIKWKN